MVVLESQLGLKPDHNLAQSLVSSVGSETLPARLLSC